MMEAINVQQFFFRSFDDFFKYLQLEYIKNTMCHTINA